MRLFVAVIPPPAALSQLGAAVAGLHALPDSGRLRWAAPATWHFTLAFLGEVDEALLPDLTERLGRAAHRHPAHELRLAGGGRFGDRVLWTGADGDVATLRALARSTGAAARRAGIPVDESRPFHAHLTLARAGGGVPLRPYAEALADFQGSPWTAERLELVHSRLPGSGVPGERPRYETVRSWGLG
ncbi:MULTISPECIES: RNA 2',3'-cyclic phosphodiesterase [Streptomyces]|uniref:RNA 2',3'-cyclic phosphodiesterase n=1 Tax=Streptomyces TaxID=1883 RepID=UPI00163B807F|nr:MULTISPECIES: RNA 2',3'-cyclic phosphodiesterase [Streptomyces]MBC2874856.1 RNA 2',3'-cyclic phosphodiesterase [Streptomyces sp. TYQ1024]UBI37304.1 RNA 2',3'-cyclic phosphodiesterase [Streptomyces mobaraensis]UKW29895.1 RNA 2',3'-cyclic phosphodiesterase [Streptomyces sp. TYQ1024]